jgi:hypothetical protein
MRFSEASVRSPNRFSLYLHDKKTPLDLCLQRHLVLSIRCKKIWRMFFSGDPAGARFGLKRGGNVRVGFFHSVHLLQRFASEVTCRDEKVANRKTLYLESKVSLE